MRRRHLISLRDASSWPWAAPATRLRGAEGFLNAYLTFDWKIVLAELERARGTSSSPWSFGYICAIGAAAHIRTHGQVGTSWEALARRLASELPCPEIAAILKVEWAAWLMGLGRYNAAVEKLAELDMKGLGTYVQTRVHTVRFVALLHLGRLAAAAPSLGALEKVAPLLEQGNVLVARCQLMYRMEREDLHKARRIVEEHPLFRVPASAREYNFQVDQIRFHFFTGDDETARRLLAFAERYSPQRIADVHGELLLRSRTDSAALTQLQAMLHDCQQSGSIIGECDTLLLMARWHLLNDDVERTHRTLAQVVALAESSGFAKALCRARILNGLARVRDGKPLDGLLDLRVAQRLARSHGFSTLSNLSAILLVALGHHAGEDDWLPVLKRLGNPRTRFEYTHVRALFPDDGFQVASVRNLFRGGRARRVSLLQVCDELLDHEQCALFHSGTGNLVFRRGPAIRTLSLRRGEVLLKGVHFVLSAPGGRFSMAALSHAIWGTRSFLPERHAVRCRSLVARLRTLFEGHIAIDFDLAGAHYRVTPLSDVLIVSRRFPSAREPAARRETEVLELIRTMEVAKSGEIGKRLGISRQALNRYLRALVECGRVRMRRRGRSTTYSPID